MKRVTTGGADAPTRYEGVLVRPGAAEFRGLPYAVRPGWGDPLPPLEREGLIDATALAPVPPQPGAPESETGPGSYLTVTVRTPWPLERPRPVLVWLCVAGNVVGRDDIPPFAASTLPDAGIVLVTVTGRLGAHGFLVLPDAPDDRAARDWLAALGWVRENIATFGGDPDAVTVGGQSAGGGAVAALLASPRAAGLFHRAIIMSTATPSTLRLPAQRATEAFAARLGVEATAAALHGVPYERLIAGVADAFGPRWRVDDPVRRVRNMVEGPPFRLVDDPTLGIGPVLPAMAGGIGARVPILAGSTAQEFTASFAELDVRATALGAAFDEIRQDGSRHVARYRAVADGSPGAALGQAFTDAVFRRTPHRMAEARAAVGSAPSYLYEVGPFEAGPTARHGVDVAAALGTAATEMPRWAAAALGSACASFVREGTPGWQPWDADHTVRPFGDGPADAGAELDDIAALWG